ncbi:MAG: ABC transporter ATP-binding protein/permease [Planctomycetota bacterium]|nr:ABC transporter ATP-binding protein/permease [Planctomycetota bacterium]
MSERTKSNRKKNQHFWRACRYLQPYWPMVGVSFVAAVFVGLATAGSLGAMLPIMRVLIHGDTVQGWRYRQSAEVRMGISLSQDRDVVQIVEVNRGGPADRAGIAIGMVIDEAEAPTNASRSPFPDPQAADPKYAGAYRAGEILRHIALADHEPVQLTVHVKPVSALSDVAPAAARVIAVNLNNDLWYSPFLLGVVDLLPVKPVQSVAVVFGLLATIAVLGQIARFFQEHLSDKAAILAVNDIRRQLYNRVLRVPLPFFGQQGTSDVTSRLVSDADSLQDGFKTILGQSIQEPIKAIVEFGVALYCSWQLTLFIVMFAPVMAIIVRKFGKKMRRASRAALQSSAVMLGQIEGTLLGIRVVKAANAERFERRRYMKIMESLIREQIRMSRIDAISAPVLETFIMWMAGTVVVFAAYLVLVKNSLSPDYFVAVMVALALIADSLRKFGKVNNARQKADAAAARIFQTLDLPVEGRDRVETPAKGLAEMPAVSVGDDDEVISRGRLAPLQKCIEFQGITFSYPNASSPALVNVDLFVPKGQSVAIVGRNGSGKTTLLALLERFYEPQSGRVAIDGVDIRSVSLASLRRQISIVTQDSVIFPGSIAENIAYGNPLARPGLASTPVRVALRQEIEDAAKRAFAHDFILEKPQGYDTLLGEMGGQLSGGQKQRLCIARAILRKSPILILDEATSQVDAESEHLIQQAIEHLMHERTTFVIAHRFSTIVSADTIVVMERGRIVGQGKHDELLRSCEIYQQLYERQLFSVAAK